MSAEGTIQFAYNLEPNTTPLPDFSELQAWRDILLRLGLVGQHAEMYEGFAYGNLSTRLDGDEGFVITASQTSGEAKLLAEHLVVIPEANLDRFWVEARGSEPPSSETVTHAMIYAADARVKSVLHVHCPEIWQQRAELKLPSTPDEVTYGSPSMVAAVAALLDEHQSRPLVFATGGHEDGVFALSTHLRDSAGLLLSYYARALALAAADA